MPSADPPHAALELDLPASPATDALGAALGRALPEAAAGEGAVLYLQGELGAGKTALVRALLRAQGVQGTIRSPTYTLLDTYLAGSGLICVHVDLYRLQVRQEVEELGLRDLVGPNTLLLIEWPERGFDALPPPDLRLALEYAAEGRHAGISAHTADGRAWLENLGRDTSLSPYLFNLT